MIISEPSVIRCVGAVVHDSRGRLLLILRDNAPGRGKWSLPGGRVEPGETDQAAVRREVREETGLSVTVGSLAGRLRWSGSQGSYEILDYHCRSDHEELCPGDDAADAAWIGHAMFTTLQRAGSLTEHLGDFLRDWGCLPRDE
ncbi:NUDIX hydrolase [Haloactinomyces albus]|uniref:ADP-ribose pyrophosphatase YjhB (NUDIX family) n=1 Tax=Haloactinomyces albus TaxID=1352928 RepID=A0AAE3ZH73_9ACTN|nr:NUDIX domain-containing protein [Haloactinomyces albus]MDR7302864.1 ADP-ribose pyrophosphatase YjhB (NUDIX family) [Haloactinomyces albus]